MKKVFVLLLFLLPISASAHVPVLISPTTVNEYITIEDPDISTGYYGELVGFPHTYTIISNKEFSLYTEINLPDVKDIAHDVKLIVVREKKVRGVEEVARIKTEDTLWEGFYEPFGGDSYLRGETFEETLPAGVYYVEVSTPSNEGKYVLTIGNIEKNDLGYFERVKRIYQVKKFFGKPGIAVVQSPFVYVPLGLTLILIGAYYYWYRRR